VPSWESRQAGLEARIRDLHERNAQLTAGFGAPHDEGRGAVGSTPEQVARAESLARAANQRALEASRRAAMMRLHAASAHERAARLHELLAGAGGDGTEQHRQQASVHRQGASDDRAAADAIFRSLRIEPPGGGG
jgi:hypothetical protein